jgi:serine/threonine-protein kinase
MNQSRERKTLELFDQAIDLEPDQIANFLRDACGEDSQLRADVESLLATMEAAEDLLPDQAKSRNSTPRFTNDLTALRQKEGNKPRLHDGDMLAARYVVNEAVGKGGMGEVYRASDTRLDREVAIKVLNVANLGHDEMHDRFNREMKSVAALSHSNIVTLYDLAEDGDVGYAVMEFVIGKTLRQWIDNGLTWQRSLKLAHGIASGLAAAHDHNLMHRDIKPENVIITDDGHAKILDFGLARPEVPNAQQNLTATEAMIPGTVPYMSPEQAEGEKLTCATDIFSLGTVFYEMLTGTNPFRGRSILDTMRRVVEAQFPQLKEPAIGIPHDLEDLVSEMLRREVSERPTAKELVQRLHRMLLDLEIGSSVTSEKVLSLETTRTETNSTTTNRTVAHPQSTNRDISEQASLAILPFEVFGTDVDLTAIADGLVENLTTVLTRVPLLSLASRSSCFALKGKEVTADSVRKALGVRYMLEGSIQEIAGAVRANVQLIDTTSGFHVWAQQFDCPSDEHTLPVLLQNTGNQVCFSLHEKYFASFGNSACSRELARSKGRR